MSLSVSLLLSILLLQVRVNLPNGDMVGHTGDIEATVVACKAADEAVKVRHQEKFAYMLCVVFIICLKVRLYINKSSLMVVDFIGLCLF